MQKLLFFLIILTSQTLIAQNVGIGLTTPLAPLHISAGASGNLTPFSPLVVEGSNNTYINLLSPNVNETGLLFGKADNAASGAIVYNNVNTLNGFQFRTAGNITQMILNNTGNLGIGVSTPNAKLSISANGTELGGTAMSNNFRTNAGILGSNTGDELSLASIGFTGGGNNISLGIRAYRTSAASSWNSTAVLLGYDVDNTVRASTGFLALSANGNMGINTVSPHASAVLDVTSTTKGMLPPRMTTVQRDAIANPTPGLMLFNTTTQSLEVFTTYGWYGLQLQLPERKLLGGSGLEEAYCIQQTADGGYIVAGNSTSTVNGDVTAVNHGPSTFDFWIVKLDANRNITWNKLLGGASDEVATSIQQTTDGGYIVSGYSYSSANGDVTQSNNGLSDYWIVKLNGTGNIEWNKLIGGSGDDKAQSVRQTPDGGYIVAGYSTSSNTGNVSQVNHGGTDYWIVKLDGSGNIIWNKLLGGTGFEESYDITVQPSDGTYVIAGQSTSSANGDVTGTNHGGVFPIDYWIVRLDNITGNILWNKLLGGTGEENAQSIQATTDDGYIIAGHSTSSANGNVTGVNHGSVGSSFDNWIVKLDRFGNITWNKLIGGSNWDKAFSIKQTTEGGYVVAGYSSSTTSGDVTGSNHGGTDYWIVKLDGTGNISWNRLIGGSGSDFPYSVIQTTDGGYIVAGFTNSSFNGDVTSGNHSGGNDYWIIKLGSNGYLY